MKKEKQSKAKLTFRYHALIFFIVMLLLWVLWYIGLKTGTQTMAQRQRFPWPVWPMVIWGIGLIYHYRFAFNRINNKINHPETPSSDL